MKSPRHTRGDLAPIASKVLVNGSSVRSPPAAQLKNAENDTSRGYDNHEFEATRR